MTLRLRDYVDTIARELGEIESTPLALLALNDEYLALLHKADSDPRYTAEGRLTIRAEAQKVATERANARAQVARDRIASLGHLLSRMRAEPTVPDAAEEMRMGAAWARIKPQLDAGTAPQALIDASAGDPSSLAALRRELPAYLATIAASQGGALTVDGAAGRAAAQDGARQLLRRLDEHEAALEGPDALRVLGHARHLEVIRESVEPAVQVAAGEIATGRSGDRLALGIGDHLRRQDAGLDNSRDQARQESRDAVAAQLQQVG